MADLRTHRELTERGEAAIVSALLALGADYVILPHLLLPGMLGPRHPDDLDVVVFGPQGAALVEYRHWHGRLTMAPHDPWVLHYAASGSEARVNPTESLKGKAQALLDHLSAHGIHPSTFVSAVVLPDRTQLEGEAEVPVVPLSRIASWIDEALGGESAPSTEQAADLLRPPTPPRMVHQYRLTSLLARDAERTTYLAYDTLRQRVVVIHELPYDPFQRPADLERNRLELLREAKLTMELQHPAIERIEQLIPQDDCYYVVGEWLDGAQNLREALFSGPMDVDTALDVAIACADALTYAHEQGVVHRNVRPEHILLAGRTVKLTHFKMAKKADLATRSTFDLRAMVQENPYAAPEFRLGAQGPHRVDARADIFALGAVLFEALTGAPPIHLDEKYWTPPSSSNRSVRLELDEVLHQALRFDPVQRFSTMAAFRERLLAVREGRRGDPHPLRYCDRRLVKRTRNSLLYRATDLEQGCEVALKKLLLDPMLTGDARRAACQRLLREAAIAASLAHPRIVTVYDCFVEDDDPYVVMEWLEGHDLRAHLDGSEPPLSFEDALDVVRQIGEALSYAHGQEIVHRDVKPENILLSGMRATLLDFGLATASTLEAAAGGTARYMAPEVLQGLPGDARSDVYSLAVVLYELWTGRYPYGAETLMARFDPETDFEGVAPPSHLNLTVTPAFDGPLLAALAVDPDDRQASVADFLCELLAAEEAPDEGGFLPFGDVPWKALALTGLGASVVGAVAIGIYLGGPGLFFGRAPLPALTQAASPAVTTAIATQPVATASLEPIPDATLVPEPTPIPQASANPAPVAGSVSYASAPVTISGVTLQVEKVVPHAEGGALVTLKVTNQSAAPIALLKPGESSDRLSVTDDRHGDYSPSIDWSSISAELGSVDPGQSVEGTFRIGTPVDPDAGLVQMLLKEAGGSGREFLLRAYRLESK